MDTKSFKRYSLTDVSSNLFYQMPKFLFEGDLKTGLSNDAKILYALLRNRHELSIMNGWVNEQGEVYIIFSREDMCEMLGISQNTIRKIVNELKKNNLMEEERQGLNKPNLIFLSYIETANSTTKIHNMDEENPQSTDTQGYAKIEGPDTQNLRVKNRKKCVSGHANFEGQEPQILSLNNKEIINNNINNTEFKNINQSINQNTGGDEKRISLSAAEMEKVREDVKEKIDYDGLVSSNPADKVIINEAAELITETICTTRMSIRVNGEGLPAQQVKERLGQLRGEHIEYVIDCVKNNSNRARNIRAYMLTALYNAGSSIDAYYTNRVASDWRGG